LSDILNSPCFISKTFR